MKITVIALGKVGLPVAVHYAALGHAVTGCDLDPTVVAAVNRGETAITHEPGLAERLAAVVAAGRLRATTDTTAGVSEAEAVIVLVPLDVDAAGRPRFGPMDAAFAAISRGMAAGALVLLETTVPVGTCRTRYLPLLEAGGRRLGSDFCFAFSPERLQSGRIAHDLATYPRVVGGVDSASAERAAAFYGENFPVPVITLASAEAAEFCKLAESIYRDVNIALANELARYAAAHDIDIHEVIPAANSQPQSHLHRPGLGVGGHCIPVYPYFLTADAEQADLTLAARAVNDGMHRHAADLLAEALGGLAGQRVLILGLTYRPGVKETAHSPALALAAELTRRGAQALGHDPLLTQEEVAGFGLEPTALAGAARVDALVLHSADPAYRDLDLAAFAGLTVLLDCAGMLDPAAVTAACVHYRAIGRPSRAPRLATVAP